MSSPDYKKANYDQILFRVRKGKREEYQQAAESLGLSFWAFLQKGVEEYISNHANEKIQLVTEKPESLSAADRRLVEEFKSLSPKNQKALREIISELVDKKGGDWNDWFRTT